MNVYLVGGAVRDQLLNYPFKERDWVVVGAAPEELLAQGFQQVGRDFPVFLHPKTREEYALARTERKRGPGYYGFACDFNPNVSLEDDLARRDLTINAMAMDESGELVDPYNGKQDIENKILRHVSSAFIEDPVRVLRVARFAARYYHLGFVLADDTRELMYKMVKNGELAHLVAERVWQEWQRSLGEKNPEVFIDTLRVCGALQAVFPEIDALFGIPHADYPEIDSGVHAMRSLQKAATITSDPMIRFAAFLQNIDDINAPISSWPIQPHDNQQEHLAIKNLCLRLRIPTEYQQIAQMAARFFYKIHNVKMHNSETIVTVLNSCDVYRRGHIFDKLLVAVEAVACRNQRTSGYKCAKNWLDLKVACEKISAQTVIAEGYKGAAIKEQLHMLRVARVESILKQWEK